MSSRTMRAALVSLIMIMSSLAGCLSADEIETEEEMLGKVIVSTYHVEQLLSAVAGDLVEVELLSTSNVPVHDYEPTANDILRLQGADVFFYHGLGLEPWVESTLSGLSTAAPTSVPTHAMPTGETTLDYESILIRELCELAEGPFERTNLSMNESSMPEIHAEHVTHSMWFPQMDHDEEDHDHDDDVPDDHDHDDDVPDDHDHDHGDDHHDDEDDHDHGDDVSDDHDHGDDVPDDHDHDHGDDHARHGHASPAETITNPSGCPSDYVIEIYELEKGDVVIEFESEDDHNFNMAVLKMGGGHAHHHQGHDEDHDDEGDHDGHDDDHDGHSDDEMTPEMILQMADSNNDSHISWDEFWEVFNSDDHDDHHGDNQDDHEDEHESKIYDGCIVNATSIDPNDGYYECWMQEWLDADGSINETDGYDEEECTELTNSSWECERHNPMDEAMEEYMMGLFYGAFNESDMYYYNGGNNNAGDGLLNMSELAIFTEEIEHVEEEMESASFAILISMFDTDDDGNLSLSEFTNFMETMNDDQDGHDDHDGMMMEMRFNMTDANSDGVVNASELEWLMEMGNDGHHDEEHGAIGFVNLHIEAEGEYGFLLPSEVTMHVLISRDAHEGHSHDDHNDHGDDDRDDHDDHGDEDRDDHDEHDDHSEEEIPYDPHSWLDPLAFKAQIDVVLGALITAFPSGNETFTANADAYKLQLDALTNGFENAFGENGTCTGEKTVVANHNAYSYLAQRYDIEFVTVYGLDPEGEPTAEDIAEVVQKISDENITVFYVEEYTDKSSVESITSQTGVTVLYLYTMEMAPSTDGEDYLSLMQKNLDNLVTGIGC